MKVSKDQLVANLLAARTAIDNVLLLVNGAQPAAKDTAPPAECKHEKRIMAMGGYWSCPCGAKGREDHL